LRKYDELLLRKIDDCKLLLTLKLLKIQKLSYAIKYSIPTVIIFWNFVEILGRWNILKEIWIEPFKYWLEILITTIVFFILLIISIFESKKINK